MLPSQVNLNLAENNDVPDLGRNKKARPRKYYFDSDDHNDDVDGDDETPENLVKQPPHNNSNNHSNSYLSPTSSFIFIDDENTDNDNSRCRKMSNSHKLSKNIVVVDDVPMCRLKPQSQIAPVFIDHENRQFLNPISYIGGPRLGTLVEVNSTNPTVATRNVSRNNLENRKSIESITSVLSID